MTYEIKVRGRLNPSWSSWFEGIATQTVEATCAEPITVLRGDLPDQAALRGVLNRLWDLNLELISVSREEREEEA